MTALRNGNKNTIPRKSIYRLSLYSRCLSRLQDQHETVSSETLARAAGVKPTQLRKDLTYLGGFGRRGLGYNVKELLSHINHTLGTHKLLPVILVGVGNLGTALLSYHGFAKEGFEVLAAFDLDPSKKKVKENTVPIHGMEHMAGFIQKNHIKLAILTVPAYVAQAVANQLTACGVTAILNFSPILLHLPPHVVVNNVNLAIELENLAYFIR